MPTTPTVTERQHAAAPAWLAPLARRQSSVSACAGRLREAIVRGGLAAGQQLPPERTLAGELGVNRTTLRAALQQLVAEGLLEAHQGRGTFVRDFARHAGPAIISAIDVDQSGLPALDVAELGRDLLLVRRSVARGVLECLVLAKPSAARVATVRAAIETLEHAVSRGAPLEEIAEADVGVLRAIVEATERPGLSLCLNPVVQALGSLPSLLAAVYAEPADNAMAFRQFLPFLDDPRTELVEPMIALLAAGDEATVARLVAERDRRRARR